MTDFSYQLYSSRNFPPLDQTLEMLKRNGYAQVEGYGGVYADPKATRAALDANGLSMPSGHFSIDLLEKEQQKVRRYCRNAWYQGCLLSTPRLGPSPDRCGGLVNLRRAA